MILDLGREIGAKLMELKGVKAVAFYGSIGRGFKDNFSDIDLVAYVNKIPSREALIKKFKGFDKFEIVLDNIFIFNYRNVEFGVQLIKISSLEEAVDKLVIGKSIDHKIAMYIQNVIPISGERIIYDFKNKIKKYPKDILKKEVTHVRGITTFFESIDKTFKRKNFLWIDIQFSQLLERIIKAIYALNGRYYSDAKWAFLEMKSFKKMPKGFVKDLNDFIGLSSMKDFKKKIILLEKILFSFSSLLNEEQKSLIKLKSKKWYDSKIREIGSIVSFK